ncbi:MAG: GntR family transcriptional regulator [Pseudomonadota bacterium]
MERLAVSLPLADRVYRAILDAICEGDLAAGRRVTQDELAQHLDVSRQPVLQALLLLKAQGFLRDSGRRGVIVSSLEPEFVAHLYEVRSALDGAACRAAASRGQAEARLWGPKLIEDGRKAVDSGSVRDMIAADMRFHLFLHELSGNPLIAETAALHWQHIRRVMGSYLRRYRARHAIWDEHAAILEAVTRGNEAEAERLARRHAEAAVANLLELIEAESASPERRHTLARGDKTGPTRRRRNAR